MATTMTSSRSNVYGLVTSCRCHLLFQDRHSLFECRAVWVLKPAAQHVNDLVDWTNVHIASVFILVMHVLHHLQQAYRQAYTHIQKRTAGRNCGGKGTQFPLYPNTDNFFLQVYVLMRYKKLVWEHHSRIVYVPCMHAAKYPLCLHTDTFARTHPHAASRHFTPPPRSLVGRCRMLASHGWQEPCRTL